MSTSTGVSVPGASCRPGPSPSAKATRLDQLRADGPAALRALVEKVGETPLDAVCAPDDVLLGVLQGAGFVPYARTVVVARRLDGMRKAPVPDRVTIDPYRNEWAEAFTRAEAVAMADFSFFKEVGSPTGFEGAEGWGAFVVARRGEEIVGFGQAELPSGWINWMGVVPDERRQGIGRAILGELAVAVRDALGSHVVCEVDEDTDTLGFWTSQGFAKRTHQVSLILR